MLKGALQWSLLPPVNHIGVSESLYILSLPTLEDEKLNKL